MTKIIFLGILSVALSNCFGQLRENYKIVSSENRKGYVYFNPSAFLDTVSAFTYPSFYKADDFTRREISISWSVNCIDGVLILTITPEQIYLKSSHNNPNPSFIYWTISNDSANYYRILSSLKRKIPKEFGGSFKNRKQAGIFLYDKTYKQSFQLSDNSSKQEEKHYWIKCKQAAANQLKKYFEILNSYIDKNHPTLIKFPSLDMVGQNRKYLGINEAEIVDWLPTRKN
jgi:hypothetical protein